MKKNQYSVSIVMGILVGAVVALLVGNTTTAILAGIITAGIATWFGSLQWERAREFATMVAKEVSVVEGAMDVFIFTLNTMRGIKTYISQLGRGALWILLVIPRMVFALATEVNARKTAMAVFVPLFILVPYSLLIFFVEDQNNKMVDIFLYATMTISALLVLVFTSVILTALLLSGPFTSHNMTEEDLMGDEPVDKFFRFMFGWFGQMILDNRGALTVTVYMLCIRTGNALRILAYPLVLIPWGFIALANNKTGIAALSAMALSGAHLSIAYLVGGINADNLNFWLSLAVAMMAGVIIGKKIYTIKES